MTIDLEKPVPCAVCQQRPGILDRFTPKPFLWQGYELVKVCRACAAMERAIVNHIEAA